MPCSIPIRKSDHRSDQALAQPEGAAPLQDGLHGLKPSIRTGYAPCCRRQASARVAQPCAFQAQPPVVAVTVAQSTSRPARPAARLCSMLSLGRREKPPRAKRCIHRGCGGARKHIVMDDCRSLARIAWNRADNVRIDTVHQCWSGRCQQRR